MPVKAVLFYAYGTLFDRLDARSEGIGRTLDDLPAFLEGLA